MTMIYTLLKILILKRKLLLRKMLRMVKIENDESFNLDDCHTNLGAD